MKRRHPVILVRLALLVGLLFGVVTTHAAAQHPGFEFLRNGESVHYVDTRGSMEFYRGIAAYKVEDGSAVFFLSNLNMENDTKHNFIVHIDYAEDEGYSIRDIHGAPEGLPEEFQQSWIDVLNFLSMRNNTDIGVEPEEFDDPWEDYTQVYRFSEIFPLFGFDRIRLARSETPGYTLDRVGRMKHEESERFFAIAPREETEYQPDPPHLEPDEHRVVSLGAAEAELDDRWQEVECDCGTAFVLQSDGERLARLALESLDLSRPPGSSGSLVSDVARIALTTDRAIPQTIRVQESGDGHLALEYEYQRRGDTVRHQRMRIEETDDEARLTTLSARRNVQDGNRAYFSRIWESVRYVEQPDAEDE